MMKFWKVVSSGMLYLGAVWYVVLVTVDAAPCFQCLRALRPFREKVTEVILATGPGNTPALILAWGSLVVPGMLLISWLLYFKYYTRPPTTGVPTKTNCG